MGMVGGYLYMLILGLVAFLPTGIMVGILSPGITIKEPAISACIASGMRCGPMDEG
jgi:hypothetical protein